MSDLSNLYPFLSGQRHDPVRLDAALIRSIGIRGKTPDRLDEGAKGVGRG